LSIRNKKLNNIDYFKIYKDKYIDNENIATMIK